MTVFDFLTGMATGIAWLAALISLANHFRPGLIGWGFCMLAIPAAVVLVHVL